jgi:hypothetical protein
VTAGGSGAGLLGAAGTGAGLTGTGWTTAVLGAGKRYQWNCRASFEGPTTYQRVWPLQLQRALSPKEKNADEARKEWIWKN